MYTKRLASIKTPHTGDSESLGVIVTLIQQQIKYIYINKLVFKL